MGNLRRTIILIWLASLFSFACRSTSKIDSGKLLTMETSQALDEVCRMDMITSSPDEVSAAERELESCLESGNLAHSWTMTLFERMKERWPEDYLAKGESAQACLRKLTNGALVRYLEMMTDACKSSNEAKAELRVGMTALLGVGSCYDFVRMTDDGCFVVEGCQLQNLNAKDFGVSFPSQSKQVVLCSENIQKIHRIKDPYNNNLLYNYSYVSELTGKQSYNHVTYGPANCHGTAQAAAGGLLDDLRLMGVQHARTANETLCQESASKFLETYKSTALSQIPMDPGGILINMRYTDCQESDCGDVKLWVEDCKDQKITSAIFIDGMCFKCWEKNLASKGLSKKKASYSGVQFAPGCILTANDHSVIMLGQSRGMCFYYEATSPYGPPQVRATPCPVLNQMFFGQYCSERPSISWRSR